MDGMLCVCCVARLCYKGAVLVVSYQVALTLYTVRVRKLRSGIQIGPFLPTENTLCNLPLCPSSCCGINGMVVAK